MFTVYVLALVAQWDACLIDDLEVLGLISTRSGIDDFFVEINQFSSVILSLLLIQEGQLSVIGESI